MDELMNAFAAAQDEMEIIIAIYELLRESSEDEEEFDKELGEDLRTAYDIRNVCRAVRDIRELLQADTPLDSWETHVVAESLMGLALKIRLHRLDPDYNGK